MSTTAKPYHIGRKISRIRELKDMKQEALAQALGTNQQAISAMENSENIDEEKLKEVAKALGMTVDAIKNFSEEAVINYFNNIYDNGAFNKHYNECTFNPLDKVIELYERLVQVEKDKKRIFREIIKREITYVIR